MISIPDPLRPYLGLIRVGLYVAVASALFIGGCQHGKSSQQAETDKVQGQFNSYVAKMVALTKQVAASAERARQEYDRKSAEAARNYEDGRKSAEQHEATVVADLRAGNLQLRQLWQGCVSSATKGETLSATGRDDGDAQLRAQAAGRVVRVGADADNLAAWLQAELMATRKLAESCGAVQ